MNNKSGAILNNIERYLWRVGGGKPKRTLALFAPNYHPDEASRRRFDYACTFWDFFKHDNNINEEKFNERFMFAWIDLNKEIRDLVCPDSYIKLLEDIEQRLIWKFHPIVNNEMLKAGIMLDKDYSKLFSIGDECGAIGKKVSEEIKRIINTYKLLKG